MTEPTLELTDRADPGAVDSAASTLDVVLAQTAGSSDTGDAVGPAGDGEGGGPDSSDLTAGVAGVDDPAPWLGHLGGAAGGDSTVGTISTIAADGGPPRRGSGSRWASCSATPAPRGRPTPRTCATT